MQPDPYQTPHSYATQMILFPTMRMLVRNLTLIVHQSNACIRAGVLSGFAVSLLAVVPAPCNGVDRRSPIIEKRVVSVLREQAHKSGAAAIAFGMVQNGSVI